MSDRGLTPGDPLGGDAAQQGDRERPPPGVSRPERERPSSGAPRPEREGERSPLWRGEEHGTVAPGYTSAPPPGAGGARPASLSYHGGGGQLVLAGWWRRVGAAVIDGLIVGAVALAIMAPLGIGIFASGDSDTGVVAFVLAFVVVALVLAVVALLYAPFLMARTNGQTFGRMATGIRVVRTSGEPMTFGWALLREVVVKGLLFNALLGSITGGLASIIDVLWPLWDEENRALHDFVVQTRTVLA